MEPNALDQQASLTLLGSMGPSAQLKRVSVASTPRRQSVQHPSECAMLGHATPSTGSASTRATTGGSAGALDEYVRLPVSGSSAVDASAHFLGGSVRYAAFDGGVGATSNDHISLQSSPAVLRSSEAATIAAGAAQFASVAMAATQPVTGMAPSSAPMLRGIAASPGLAAGPTAGRAAASPSPAVVHARGVASRAVPVAADEAAAVVSVPLETLSAPARTFQTEQGSEAWGAMNTWARSVLVSDKAVSGVPPVAGKSAVARGTGVAAATPKTNANSWTWKVDGQRPAPRRRAPATSEGDASSDDEALVEDEVEEFDLGVCAPCRKWHCDPRMLSANRRRPKQAAPSASRETVDTDDD